MIIFWTRSRNLLIPIFIWIESVRLQKLFITRKGKICTCDILRILLSRPYKLLAKMKG